MRLAEGTLVVLVGPPGSGKSTWAAAQFRPDQVVSSDALRAVVGAGEHDQRASKDAFDVLDLVVERRLRRRLTTVVDTLGTDAKRRRRWRDAAAEAGVRCVAVVFDVDTAVARSRNRSRERPVPGPVLSSMLAGWRINNEPFRTHWHWIVGGILFMGVVSVGTVWLQRRRARREETASSSMSRRGTRRRSS